MKYNQYLIAPANTSTTGFASNVTGSTFTLTANSSGDGLAHKVTILNDSATDHSGKTIDLVGTDENGIAQTETVTGPAGSATVTSTKYWLTLTSATPSATIGANTFDIGWANAFVTKAFPINWRRGEAALNLDITGTINLDINETFDDIQFKTTAFTWIVDSSAHSGITADTSFLWAAHPKALRYKINSFTDGATVMASYTQRDY